MKLVMIHGRSQEGKDQAELREAWLDTLTYGLARADQTLPSGTVVEFPFYGNLLADLVVQVATPLGAEINSKGPNPDEVDQEFRGEIVGEIAASAGLTDADIQREGEGPVEKGPGNWEWIQATLRALDRIPGFNAWVIDEFARDVYVYLTFPGVRRKVDGIIDGAIGSDPCVVLGHSLGSVIAYNVLRQRGAALKCPRLVTVGSPLGLRAIKRHLDPPLDSPRGVNNWFNAYDDRDPVALVALDAKNFDVRPPVENKSDVINFTDNRHAIAGYLSDPIVASKLVEHLH